MGEGAHRALPVTLLTVRSGEPGPPSHAAAAVLPRTASACHDDPVNSKINALIDDIGSSILDAVDGADPLGAEAVGSAVLDTTLVGQGDALWTALLDRCGAVATPRAHAVALIIAVLAPDLRLRSHAAEVAARLTDRLGRPGWSAALDRSELIGCRQMTDVFGDRATVVAEFGRGPLLSAVPHHALLFQLDNNGPGPWVKDVYVVGDVDAAYTQLGAVAAEGGELARLEDVPLDQARALLEPALAAAVRAEEDSFYDAPGQAVFRFRLLAEARLRALPELSQVPSGPLGAPDAEELISSFAGSEQARVTTAGGIDAGELRRWAEVIVRYGNEHDDGRPLRVGPGKTLALLLDTEVEDDDAQLAAWASVVAAWNDWAGERTGLSDAVLTILSEATDELLEEVLGVIRVDDLDEPDVSRSGGSGTGTALQVRVDLHHARPPIWRRLLLPASLPLDDLHLTLQLAFDWDGSHLHHFDSGGRYFGDLFQLDDVEDESLFRVADVLAHEGDRLDYMYDFGDSWLHRIVVEKVTTSTQREVRCLGGRRAAPPEDCGGIYRYGALAHAWGKPDEDLFDEAHEWIHQDPAVFSTSDVDDRLSDVPVST